MQRPPRQLTGAAIVGEKSRDPWGAQRAPSVSEHRALQLVNYGVIGLALVLALRLTYLQTLARPYYLAVADELYGDPRPEVPPPGRILDAQNRPLAIAVPAAHVAAKPKDLHTKNADLDAVRECLSGTLGLPPDRIERLLSSDANFAYVARLVPAPQAEKVMAYKFNGLYLEPTYRRAYPNGRLACHLLGGYTQDQRPRGGLDLRYAFALQGQPGTPARNVDAWGRRIIGQEDEEVLDPLPAQIVVTTLDLEIQREVEAALDTIMAQNKPDSACAIVMEPRSGAVLAMSSRPGFDPNRFSVDPQALRNPAVNWVYEPGSTFKILAAAAALDSGAVTPDSSFHCGGTMEIGGRPLKCWGRYAARGHGNLSVSGILAQSCNLGAAQMARRMGAQRYEAFLQRCLLGQRTGIGLPGEESGHLYPADSLRTRDLANMGFGQHVLVTPLQLIAAISAVLNDGRYMQPQIVRRVLNADGTVYREVAPYARGLVCSPTTSRQVRQMMVGVVERGTGRGARIPGVAVGGKTGTAQIWDPQIRAFSSSRFVMSFVLAAPADRVPDFVILVVANGPRIGEHGSDVAGPAAKSIAEFILRRAGRSGPGLPGSATPAPNHAQAQPHT